MKTLHRNKRKLYLCQVYQDGSSKRYREPIKLFANWQVVRTDSEFKNLGLEVYDYIKIKVDKTDSNLYHLGDKLYINVEPPEIHSTVCKDADYYVYSDPLITLEECTVVAKKLSGRNGDKNIF